MKVEGLGFLGFLVWEKRKFWFLK